MVGLGCWHTNLITCERYFLRLPTVSLYLAVDIERRCIHHAMLHIIQKEYAFVEGYSINGISSHIYVYAFSNEELFIGMYTYYMWRLLMLHNILVKLWFYINENMIEDKAYARSPIIGKYFPCVTWGNAEMIRRLMYAVINWSLMITLIWTLLWKARIILFYTIHILPKLLIASE